MPATGPDPNARSIAIYLDGSDDPDRAQNGTPLADNRLPGPGQLLVGAPRLRPSPTRPGAQWHAEIDSYDPATPAQAPARSAGDQVTIGPRSVTVLRAQRPR